MDSIHYIYNWYLKNKRDLPFRGIHDPYLIWVSEIILQQTRMEQGLPYYTTFINRFPNVYALANAELNDVLLVWKGLGYYRRAIYMHEAAKDVVNKYNGVFPQTFDELLTLKGIGKYTAAAIASFAFGEKTPVVDGNVIRVFARWMMLPYDKANPILYKLIQEHLKKAMDSLDSGTLNQSLMEYGALMCTPQSPNCSGCVVKKNCKAFLQHVVEQYPIVTEKKVSPKLYYNYVFVKNNKDCLMHKRNSDDIWKGLYEFPLISSSRLLNLADLQKNEFFKTWFEKMPLTFIGKTESLKHVLSHRIIYAQLFVFESKSKKKFAQHEWIPIKSIDKMPVPRLIEKLCKLI